MHPLLAPRHPWKALLTLLPLLCALPPPAHAQTQPTAQTQKAKKSKSKARPKTPAPSAEKPAGTEPEQVQPQEPAKPLAADKPQEPVRAPPAAKPPPAPKPPAPPKVVVPDRPQSQVQAEERALAQSRMRVGVGLDLFLDKSHLNGEQIINASRKDESFDFGSATFLSATLSLNVPAPIAADRARMGGGVRLFGNYGTSGDRSFGFGLLGQAFVLGEYGLPVADKTEVMFGGRVGLSLLLPGRDFGQEIDRLQAQGVGVWSVPRVGWLAGLSVGGRRRMSEHILLRADLSGQLDALYLFATDETIEGLDFRKSWSTFGLRLGLTLGIEFAL